MGVHDYLSDDTNYLIKLSINTCNTVMNVVSGTREFLPLEPPVPHTGGGRPSLGEIENLFPLLFQWYAFSIILKIDAKYMV